MLEWHALGVEFGLPMCIIDATVAKGEASLVSAKKILITGCKQSGKTLLLSLMHCFSNVPRIHHRPASWISVVENDTGGVWVGNDSTPLCGRSDAMISIAMKRLIDSGVKIIHVRRGRDSVLLDVNEDGYEDVYDDIEEAALEFYDSLSMVVTLPGILAETTTVQELISKALEMDYHTKFSRYPDMVPSHVLRSPNYPWKDVKLDLDI